MRRRIASAVIKTKQITKFSRLQTLADKYYTMRWQFRGVLREDYELIPKIGRSEIRCSGAYSVENELWLLREFKKRAPARLLQENLPQSDWEWLALAQHHGLPTRLLDWTTNPYVGLLRRRSHAILG